jgi:hypothetical protein
MSHRHTKSRDMTSLRPAVCPGVRALVERRWLPP